MTIMRYNSFVLSSPGRPTDSALIPWAATLTILSVSILTVNLLFLSCLQVTHQTTTKPQKLFLLLSSADLLVGISALPSYIFLVTVWQLEILFVISYCCLVIPTTLSASVTFVMAIDMYIKAVYNYNVTLKRLLVPVLIMVLLLALPQIVKPMLVRFPDNIYLDTYLDLLFIGVSIAGIAAITVAYTRLVYFVHKQSISVRDWQHTGRNQVHYSKRLIRTVSYLLISQVSCYSVYIAIRLTLTAFEEIKQDKLSNASIGMVIVLCSNSFTSTSICICRNKKVKSLIRRKLLRKL